MLFTQNSGDRDAKKLSAAVLRSPYLSNFSLVDGVSKDRINNSLMKQGPATTVDRQPGANQALRFPGECPKRCVVRHCNTVDEHLSVSVISLELRRPLFESDWRRR